MTEVAQTKRFRVRYYDPKHGGVWSREFDRREDAEAFAAQNRLYAQRARVEELRGP